MLINRSTTVALSCPACGRLEMESINIFELAAAETKHLNCSCGAVKASIKQISKLKLKLNYFCLHCDRSHSIVISKQKFWYNNQLFSLSCQETGLNPGFFGPTDLLNKEMKKEKQDLELMAAELGFDDFKNPDIMLKVVDIIHDLAAENNLDCQCGSNDVNIELFFDKIQLICNQCSSYLNLKAENKNDLKNLKKLDSIQLHSVQGKSNNF